MRRGVPRGRHDHVGTFCANVDPYGEQLQIANKSDGCVFLLDRDGGKASLLRRMPFLAFLLTILGMGEVLASNSDAEHLLKQARERFYQSVKDRTQIDPAMRLFQTIAELDTEYEGRALTYLGALIALKGKHTLWPHRKLKWVNQGLALMDKGIAISPDDPEALFIHGSTCYHLPFFFGRGEDAQRDFKKIVVILSARRHAYDPELMLNVIRFISEHAHLDAHNLETIRKLKADLTKE